MPVFLPLRDFARSDVRERFAVAVRSAVVPEVLGEATAEQAEEAVARAAKAFPAWRDLEPIERCRMIVNAASRLRERRDELAGIVIQEAGKTWREADADVCEAIDFCEYYARSAVALFRPRRLPKCPASRGSLREWSARWAGRTRSSSTTPPIWTKPCWACASRPSAKAARNARRAAGLSWSSRCSASWRPPASRKRFIWPMPRATS